MYHNRPKKENNECQTDLQCTPFILSENETAKVHSSRLCQTEIHLSPRAPDSELYEIIPYIDKDDIEKDAIRLINIPQNENAKLKLVLPENNNDESSNIHDNDDNENSITDHSDENIRLSKFSDSMKIFSNESFHINERQDTKLRNIESTSSIGTIKSTIKNILKENDSTQTDLMIAPHILNKREMAIITKNTSCQTSLTCSPNTSITNLVPMLSTYWKHHGETREGFNKSENVLEILKEVIQDVINIHQHMFDPDYNLPIMNPVLIKIGQTHSSKDSSEWDLSNSKAAKKPIRDSSGDGSYEDFKQTITSVSTVSEITTYRSSDFTLSSTKDDYDDTDDNKIYEDDASEIINHITEKYKTSNTEEIETLTNPKMTQSEPIVVNRIETEEIGGKIESEIKPEIKSEMKSEIKSEIESLIKPTNTSKDILDNEKINAIDSIINECKIINSNCICSGINIKLYLKDKSSDTKNSDQFIELKIKPDAETIEIKKLLNISTDPELCEIGTSIPFQEIENCLKEQTNNINNTGDTTKVFLQQPTNTDNTKTNNSFQIMISKDNVLVPKTKSEEFLHSFLEKKFLPHDIENTPYPEMVDKVSFPNNICPIDNNINTTQLKPCVCYSECNQNMLSEDQFIPESILPFTTVFNRMYEKSDDLLPFDKNDRICICKTDENEAVLSDIEYDKLSVNTNVKSNENINECNLKFDEIDPIKILNNEYDNLKNMSSYVIVPKQQSITSNENNNTCSTERRKTHDMILAHHDEDKNSITYDGHVYQTDSFLLPKSMNGSSESISSQTKPRRQTFTISYEEHMYQTHSTEMPHHSESFLADMDCVCSMKLEKSLRECPHCFKRIGPQYGRTKKKMSEEQDHDSNINFTDYCSRKQNSVDQNSDLFHQASIDTLTEYPRISYSSSHPKIDVKSPTSLDKNETINRNESRSISSYTKINNESTTEKLKGNITFNIPESKSISNSNISEQSDYTTGELIKKYDSENEETSNDLMDTQSENISNLKVISSLTSKMNDIVNELVKADLDKDVENQSKHVEFIKKVYPTGKIIIGKINNEGDDEATKINDTESKVRIIYDKSEQILSDTTDIVKQPENLQYNESLNNETSSPNRIIEDNEKKYKTKCQNCMKAKLNKSSKKNLSIVTLKEVCSISSSTDKIVQHNININKSPDCFAICNKSNEKSTIMLKAKAPVEDLPKLVEKAQEMEEKSLQNVTKTKCKPCTYNINKEEHDPKNLIETNQQDKISLEASKNKCSTCFKSLKNANTVEVLHSFQSKSLHCTSAKSKCHQNKNFNTNESFNLNEMEYSQGSITNTKSKNMSSHQNILNYKCSEILEQVKSKLENETEAQDWQLKNLDEFQFPNVPDNSYQSNCKCVDCILSRNLKETNESTSEKNYSSQCQNLPDYLIEKIVKEKLPCSCDSDKNQEPDDNDQLLEKINTYPVENNKVESASNISTESIIEQIPLSSSFASENKNITENENMTENKNITENTVNQLKVEELVNDDHEIAELLSSFTITTQPRVQILQTPKYIYETYSSIFDSQCTNNNEDDSIHLNHSIDNMNNELGSVGNSYFKKAKSHNDFILANLSENNSDINKSNITTTTFETKSNKNMKIMNIYKFDGKYSVFSLERKNNMDEYETTIYILPNAIFSSLLSVPPPQFLRERTDSEIDDILQFSYIRNSHYDKNSECSEDIIAITDSKYVPDEITNVIPDQNKLQHPNCTIACGCSSLRLKREKQQADKTNENIKIDKSTSITNLKDLKNGEHNSVGIQKSFVLFHNNSYVVNPDPFPKLSKLALQSTSFKDTEILRNNIYNPLHIMGKYITWQDLINPNFYKPISVQNTFTSFDPKTMDIGIQTSDVSNRNSWLQSSTLQPLTIEASTSTGNLGVETSIVSASRYQLSENFSPVNLPFQYSNIQIDSSTSMTNNILQKYIFKSPTIVQALKQITLPELTIDSSTSTSINQAMVQTGDFDAPNLPNILISRSIPLINTNSSKENIKDTLSKSSNSKTTSSISLAHASSSHNYPTISKPTKEATPMKSSSTKITSQITNSTTKETSAIEVKTQKTSTNDMSSSIPMMKITKTNKLELDKTDFSNLEQMDSSSQENKSIGQISYLSLPKIESFNSISISNTNVVEFKLNTEQQVNEDKVLSENNLNVTENQPDITSGTTNEDDEYFVKETNYTSEKISSFHDTIIPKSSADFNAKTVTNDKLNLENISSSKWNISSQSPNYIKSNKFTSESSSYVNNVDKLNSLNKSEDLDTKRNANFDKDSLEINTFKDIKIDDKNTSSSYKENESKHLLSKTIDSYVKYLTLKKEISSNLNISNINLSNNLELEKKDTAVYPKFITKDEKDKPIQHKIKNFQSGSANAKIEDTNSTYPKRKDKIPSFASLANKDLSYNRFKYSKEKEKEFLKLSHLNINSPYINSFEESKKEKYLPKTEKEKLENKYPGNVLNNRDNLHSENNISNDLKPINNYVSKNKEQDRKLSPLSSILKKKSSYQSSYTNSSMSNSPGSDKFILKNNNIASKFEDNINVLDKKLHKTRENNSYNIDSEYSKIIKRKQHSSPKVSRITNQSLFGFTNKDNYLKRYMKQENESPLSSMKKNELIHKSTTLEMNKKYNSTTENITNQNKYKNLKSDKFFFNTRDNYSAYLEHQEEISQNKSPRKMTSPYLQSISKKGSSKDLKPDIYSIYKKQDETNSPVRSTSKITSSYLQSVSGSENSKDLRSNKFVLTPENRERVSSKKNNSYYDNNNAANNKNSATSKISSFVRSGTTSALLGNNRDSTQHFSKEKLNDTDLDSTVSSRVLETVQSCEQRLQPIKSALKDIKMKLKELNMPEVNGILQNDDATDENNKTYIYLPPPPSPFGGSNPCSYRTKMTFQLKKPINKPLNITANVNPFSIKHKYILNDTHNNYDTLNPNYSSVSDPPYYIQRSSMNSMKPNFLNQPSHSENKPLHFRRYQPDKYIEKAYGANKPIKIIEEDLPFSSDDLDGYKTMDEFEQYQYLPDTYEMYYYEPRSESLNNYVVFPPILKDMKESKHSIHVENSVNKTHNQHVFNNNHKMFTGDYPVLKNKPKK